MRVFAFVAFIAVVLQVTMAENRSAAPKFNAREPQPPAEPEPSAEPEDIHGYGGDTDNADNAGHNEPPACKADAKCRSCGDNEVFSCVNPRVGCTDKCDHRLKNSGFCSDQKGPNCPCMECQCRAGFARDSNNVCVLFSKCPANIKCGENEYHSTVKSRCYTDSCDRRDIAARNDICFDGSDGEGGCVCEFDYARHPITNKCILKKDCPTGCTTNEIAVSCKICQPSDSCADSANPNKKVPAICKTLPPANCQSGCNCKKDYYRSPYAFNQCVPLCNCPEVRNLTSEGSSGDGPPAGGSATGSKAPGFFPMAGGSYRNGYS